MLLDTTKPRWSTGPWPASTVEAPDDETEAFELAQRIGASDVGSVTLDAVELGVEDLCRSYTATTPEEILGTVRRYRRAIAHLLDGRATLAERRRLMVLGGWVSLLAACVHVDLGSTFIKTSCGARRSGGAGSSCAGIGAGPFR